MNINWDDLRLFIDVASAGGLSAAGRSSGLSPATLGRRIGALEAAIGEPLFIRAQTGYRLTEAGEALLEQARDVERATTAITRWRAERHGERVVKVSAGHWTSQFLAAHIADLWTPRDRFRLELTTATEKIDIGHRHADLGLRNARPTEQWLAGRQLGAVAFALYSGRQLVNGVTEGLFVGLSGPARTPSARWLEAHHGDRIGVRGNAPAAIRELVAAGAGLSVFPCFMADADPRLKRVAGIIEELTHDQWLVSHHEERHTPQIRRLGDRIAALIRAERPLFLGERPIP